MAVCKDCSIENEDGSAICRSCGKELNRPVAVGVIEYAGFWKRAAAAVIDSLVIFILGSLAGVVYINVLGNKENLEIASNIIGVFIGWVYFATMESGERQATIGKKAMGLIVTDIRGERLSFYRASGRHFGKFVSSITLGVGFAMAGFTEKKQALHDKMFDCLVIINNEKGKDNG
jgi:uncharacterized RDD family membrane protein YckC